jgi:predicted transposase
MKLVATIQLTPTKDEAKLLRQTLEACNAACNAASQLGFEKFGPKKVRQFNLQKVVYQRLRDDFGLTAQAAVRSIAKVADAYKAAKVDVAWTQKNDANGPEAIGGVGPLWRGSNIVIRRTPLRGPLSLASAGARVWRPFEDGETGSSEGSKGGTFLRDEEYDAGARITLERCAYGISFALTCGIYGWFIHTRFLGSKG